MARVVHFELCADDPERAVKFYEDVFGWQIQKWDGPQDYWLITTGEPSTSGIDGALMRREPGMSTIDTIGVDSVDDAVARITARGGTVAAPKMAIPGVG